MALTFFLEKRACRKIISLFIRPWASWGGPGTYCNSKTELAGTLVNGWKPLAISTKNSITDVTATPDPSLVSTHSCSLSLFGNTVLTFTRNIAWDFYFFFFVLNS